MDISHGFQGHLDGLVALVSVARLNVTNVGGGPPALWDLQSPDFFIKVHKSYMILYMTNNSNTPVYGKMAVFKPRKNINNSVQTPGYLANQDLSNKDSVTNEYLSNQVGIPNDLYSEYPGVTDLVAATSLADMGWTWHNSPSFNRYWKGKMKNVTWAPMECKKFIFKMRKSFSIDALSEYSLSPSTSSLTADWTEPGIYLSPSDTGFSYMHKGRGFFVSFLLHGIPARDATDSTIGLTQPNMDLYWLNAYKYSWNTPSRREYHVNPNPLAVAAPNIVQMFSPTPGAVVLG